MRKGFLIYEEMHKYLTIYEEAASHIQYDFATDPFWISLYIRKILFSFFISAGCNADQALDSTEVIDNLKVLIGGHLTWCMEDPRSLRCLSCKKKRAGGIFKCYLWKSSS
jgi:hypothetical protein